MTKWYTSDTHFRHKNILKYCSRPFYTTRHMDLTIMYNWNSRVKPNDEVYHLGDFAFCGVTYMREIFNQLNGRKHLIIGNHDHKKVFNLGWESVSQYKVVNDEGFRLVLMHYPIEDWDDREKESYHLHGHAHGTAAIKSKRFDVGVDVQGYKPVTLMELLHGSQ